MSDVLLPSAEMAYSTPDAQGFYGPYGGTFVPETVIPALTDLAGANRVLLKPAAVYRFPVRPQQIVTMRFRTRNAVAGIQSLTDWTPLVPEAKRAALNTRIDKKGHPPRGDAPKEPGSNKP